MHKKIFVLLITIYLAASLVGCNASSRGEKNIVFITDIAGLGDKSSNDTVYEGLKRAEEEFDVVINVVESETIDSYTQNIAEQSRENYDLIITVGLPMASAVADVSATFPEQNYVTIDESIDQSNIASVTYKEQEGSFLLGVIAGLTTKSNIIGFVGGVKTDITEKYEYGFRAGVKSVNQNAEVLVEYIEAFDEISLGKNTAARQYEIGADIIYHVAGWSGLGVIEAGSENDFWVINSQEDLPIVDTETILGSMIKRLDTTAYTMVKSIVEGNFTAGKVELGLKEEVIEFSDKSNNILPEVIQVANEYREFIIKNEIRVPFDEITYDEFEKSLVSGQ
ncbi:BMP family lipoprotein [Alkalibaculum sporogenes]|uniref:BMP family lipoprotein n=1 Tax=Alkalibaculum sporogenes TaxID=2655001 RepID=UPI00187B4E1F|nr:BMP family ABC transporter substrate-binding protein [Alkalibaculum sporogenes]